MAFCICAHLFIIDMLFVGRGSVAINLALKQYCGTGTFWDLDFLRNKSNSYGKYVSKAINTRLRLPSLMSLGKIVFLLNCGVGSRA